jgi:hypothetical protein
MAERDPVVAQRLLWASSGSHLDKLSQGNDDPERQWNIDTDFLNPISVEEKKVAVTNYLEVMDPKSTIYACACCGEWVIKLKSKEPNKRYIKDLHILELSDSLKLKYQNVPDGFKRIKGVTETTDGKYYGLYRPYLDVATDPHETCYPDAPVDSDTTSAFLCDACYKSTGGSNPVQPLMSLVKGVDYGLAHIYMPELPFIGRLLLCTSQPYGHIFLFGGKTGYLGMKGHMITMKTNAGNTTATAASTMPLTIPRSSFSMEFMYVGHMDKWETIKRRGQGRTDFIALHGKVLDLKSDALYMWVELLRSTYPHLYQGTDES